MTRCEPSSPSSFPLPTSEVVSQLLLLHAFPSRLSSLSLAVCVLPASPFSLNLPGHVFSFPSCFLFSPALISFFLLVAFPVPPIFFPPPGLCAFPSCPDCPRVMDGFTPAWRLRCLYGDECLVAEEER